jgi:hypothetical protein
VSALPGCVGVPGLSRFPCLGCGRVTTGIPCPRCSVLEGRRRAPARSIYDSAAWHRLARAVVSGASRCHWCGRTGVRLSADHVLGLRARPDLALDPSNLVPRCYACQNQRKGQA